MKKGLDPFRASRLLQVEEPVESIACSEAAVYVGTASGSLLQYDVAWSGSIEDVAASIRKGGTVKLASKCAIECVRTAPGLVLALVDGSIHVLAEDLQSASPAILCKDAKHFCVRLGAEAGEEEARRSQSSRPIQVCVAKKKQLVLYTITGNVFEQQQEFPTAEPAMALAWYSTWICAGFRREYSLYSDRAGVPREICHFEGKSTPQIAVGQSGELLLLIQENIGLFYNLSTQQPSPKSTVIWQRRVGQIASSGGYILGTAAGGQVDIFSSRDQKNCQTLMLEGSSVGVCGVVGGRALIAAHDGRIMCLDPVPFERQVQMLLLQVRVSDALDLLNASFAPEDPRRLDQLSKFHVSAGWALFCDLQFAQAFRHFTYAPALPVAHVLAFWHSRLPGGMEHPCFVGLGDHAKRLDSGAPEPQDLGDFILERLAAKRSSGGGGRSGPEEDDSLAKLSALTEFANAALVSFLMRQREAIFAQERLPMAQRAPAVARDLGPSLAEDLGPLLRAVDTVLLKLLVETNAEEARLQELLAAGVKFTVSDCEDFLRERKRFDVLVRVWKGRGMFDMALKQLAGMLRDGSGVTTFSRPKIVSEMADTLLRAASTQCGAELLRQYLPQLLGADATAALALFTGDTVGGGEGSLTSPPPPVALCLGADEVLELLAGHDELVLKFLESHVLHRSGVDPKHRLRLGLIYLSQVADEVKTKVSSGGRREKLAQFLEHSEGLDMRSLLSRAQKLELHAECVILHCHENEHMEALKLMVEAMNDVPGAETYCRIIMAREAAPSLLHSRSAGVGTLGLEGSRTVKVSVLSPQLPQWAKPEVFRVKKLAGNADDEESPEISSDDLAAAALERDNAFGFAALRHSAMGLAGSGGSRPLMLLLRVLLDASVAAESEPQSYRKVAAEYREAANALLLGYLGHHDLPPNEVVGMLPADWTLRSLSEYLAKSTRFWLHECRAGMLEENLSSMAYLKTFDALAHERMKKVTITSDRCCPVCNRRFVDKDSVGKAFVAYPNETCVHLQCKEDNHTCPKTGRKFVDNLSVFCNALVMD